MAGVYISYPFCAQKCTFCNFASGVFPESLQQEYAEVLASEIRSHVWEWTPETAYLGGGTPSGLDPQTLESILAAVPGRPWRECTIEAAPGSLSAKKVKAWRDAGANRVSLGVQSFVTRELRQTGRKHDAKIVEEDCALLRTNGLDNINIDLIAGLPFQTKATWIESLDWIERLEPPHVSVYLFEIDEDSRLGLEVLNQGSRYGAAEIPSDDLSADLYEMAVERLHAMGIERYEISNFARAGMESHHNLKYWRMEPYRGFGVDAHSFDGSQRSANVDSVSAYIERSRAGEPVCSESTAARVDEERLFLGLRLTKGVSPTLGEWERFSGPIARSIAAGLLEKKGEAVRLTNRGVLLSNEVFQEFITA
jgi:oxygen-independent coproporphyrinogen III oxidase